MVFFNFTCDNITVISYDRQVTLVYVYLLYQVYPKRKKSFVLIFKFLKILKILMWENNANKLVSMTEGWLSKKPFDRAATVYISFFSPPGWDKHQTLRPDDDTAR